MWFRRRILGKGSAVPRLLQTYVELRLGGWQGDKKGARGHACPREWAPGNSGPHWEGSQQAAGGGHICISACPTLDIICRTQGKMKSQKVINHCRTEAAEQWPERGAILSTELGDCHSGLSFLTWSLKRPHAVTKLMEGAFPSRGDLSSSGNDLWMVFPPSVPKGCQALWPRVGVPGDVGSQGCSGCHTPLRLPSPCWALRCPLWGQGQAYREDVPWGERTEPQEALGTGHF